jgi:hypothetical protein
VHYGALSVFYGRTDIGVWCVSLGRRDSSGGPNRFGRKLHRAPRGYKRRAR